MRCPSLSFLSLILLLPAVGCGLDGESSSSRRITPGPEQGGDPPVLCWSDSDCQMGQTCSTADVCLPPPGCDPGDDCLAVCYGQCEQTGPDECVIPPDFCEKSCAGEPTPDLPPGCQVACACPNPPTCGDDGECPEGSHCEYLCPPCMEGGMCDCIEQCVPDAPPLPEACESYSDCPSGYGCAESCSGTCAPNGGPCITECHGECQPLGWCGDDDDGSTMPGGGDDDSPTMPLPL